MYIYIHAYRFALSLALPLSLFSLSLFLSPMTYAPLLIHSVSLRSESIYSVFLHFASILFLYTLASILFHYIAHPFCMKSLYTLHPISLSTLLHRTTCTQRARACAAQAPSSSVRASEPAKKREREGGGTERELGRGGREGGRERQRERGNYVQRDRETER